jgi:hypothetical protein
MSPWDGTKHPHGCLVRAPHLGVRRFVSRVPSIDLALSFAYIKVPRSELSQNQSIFVVYVNSKNYVLPDIVHRRSARRWCLAIYLRKSW